MSLHTRPGHARVDTTARRTPWPLRLAVLVAVVLLVATPFIGTALALWLAAHP